MSGETDWADREDMHSIFEGSRDASAIASLLLGNAINNPDFADDIDSVQDALFILTENISRIRSAWRLMDKRRLERNAQS